MNSMTYSNSEVIFTINNISMSVSSSNSPSVFFKATFHANPGAVREQPWSSPYILRKMFRKLLNVSIIN